MIFEKSWLKPIGNDYNLQIFSKEIIRRLLSSLISKNTYKIFYIDLLINWLNMDTIEKSSYEKSSTFPNQEYYKWIRITSSSWEESNR